MPRDANKTITQENEIVMDIYKCWSEIGVIFLKLTTAIYFIGFSCAQDPPGLYIIF